MYSAALHFAPNANSLSRTRSKEGITYGVGLAFICRPPGLPNVLIFLVDSLYDVKRLGRSGVSLQYWKFIWRSGLRFEFADG